MTNVILFVNTILLPTFYFFILTLSCDRLVSVWNKTTSESSSFNQHHKTEVDGDMLLHSFLNYRIILIPIPVMDQEHVWMLQSYYISKLEFRVLWPVKNSLRKLQGENRLNNSHISYRKIFLILTLYLLAPEFWVCFFICCLFVLFSINLLSGSACIYSFVYSNR